MNYIYFMGINIPIIKELTLTGTNPAWYISVNQLGLTAYECYRDAAYCGYADLDYDADRHVYLPNTPITSANAGSLDLHDGWRVRARGPLYTAPNQNIEWYVDTDETTARSGTLPVAFGHTGGFSSYRETTTRIFAWSYAYPAAAAEPYQRKSYCITTVSETISYRADGSISQIGYALNAGTPLEVPVARLNVTYEADTYIEEIPEPDPDEPPFDPTEDPTPYTPNIDDTSDLVTIPNNPLIGVTGAGFINVYNPAMGALQGLGDVLFPNVASATDVLEAILKLCETLANQNLINYVIDCHVIPVQPQIGTNANIKVGFRDTGISVPRVTNDYIDATCGSLNIREYFGGFQDYQATKSKIYLPFIGFVDTKPEYWQSGTISIDYKFNVIDGSFMAYVRSTSSKSQLAGSVIAQYAGNACMHFPITGVNYASMVSGLIGAAVGAAPTISNVSPTLGAAYSAANTLAQGGDIQQSNGYNSTAALLGVRTPYLLIERAVPAYSAKYAHDKGFPTNIATGLSNVSGYTEISDIDLTGLPFTSDELTELRQLLADGVYF